MQFPHEDSDSSIFLLSTDWFSAWLTLLGAWPADDERSLGRIRDAARKVSDVVFAGESNYFHADLSRERRGASFDAFMSTVRSTVGRRSVESLGSVICHVQGGQWLSREECWSFRIFLLAESTAGFKGDHDWLLNAALREAITQNFRELDSASVKFPPQSSWDVSLKGRFDGLPEYLIDYAEAGFVPSVFVEFFAGEVARLNYNREAVGDIGRWICRGALNLGLRLNEEAVASALWNVSSSDTRK